MKIVHLCLQAPYNDYWGYQDNLLPKYHRKQGHDVTVITTNTMHEKGKIVSVDTNDYTLSDGQRIIRLNYEKFRLKKFGLLLKYFKIYNILCEIKPDFIMVHGLGNISVLQVAKYVRKVNPSCRVVADNHMDFYNGVGLLTPRQLPFRILYRLVNAKMQKYYSIVFGITPWRVDYMQKIFGIKKSKSQMLIMGGDDEKIAFEKRDKLREEIRKKHNIDSDAFLIVTGGKIDKTKNIHLLMEAVINTDADNIALIVFGQANAEMEQEIAELAKNLRIRVIGWVSADEAYDYFLASELVVFPGTHSVMWEQACACGVPCVFKHWEGMHHVDVGGNCEFLYEDSAEEMKKIIEDIVEDKEKYAKMKNAAQKGIKEFSYNEIAKRAINT